MRENLEYACTPFGGAAPPRRRAPVALRADTVFPSDHLSIKLNYHGLDTPPPSARDDHGRRLSAFSECSLGPSLCTGPSSAEYTPEVHPTVMPHNLLDGYILNSSHNATYLQDQYKQSQLTAAPYSFKPEHETPTIDGNFRFAGNGLVYQASEPVVFDSTSAFAGACGEPDYQTDDFAIQHAPPKWQTNALHINQHSMNDPSLALALFQTSDQSQSTCTLASSSFTTTLTSLPTPATSSFSSAPGSAFSTCFDIKPIYQHNRQYLPPQAFNDESFSTTQSMYVEYGDDGSFSPPMDQSMESSQTLLSSPCGYSSSSLVTRHFKHDKSSSPVPSEKKTCLFRPTQRPKSSKRRAAKARCSGPTYDKSIDTKGTIVTVKIEPWECTSREEAIQSSRDGKVFCTFERGEDKCGQGFRRPEHLKRHMGKHTGKKPFHCPFDEMRREFIEAGWQHPCTRCVSRNDNLLDHISTHVSHHLAKMHESTYGVSSYPNSIKPKKKIKKRNDPASPTTTEELMFELYSPEDALRKLHSIQKKLNKEFEGVFFDCLHDIKT